MSVSDWLPQIQTAPVRRPTLGADAVSVPRPLRVELRPPPEPEQPRDRPDGVRLAPCPSGEAIRPPLARLRVEHRDLVRDGERVPGAAAAVEAERVGVEAVLLQEDVEAF